MLKGNNLDELPRGEQTFEAVPFPIRQGVIQLAGSFLPKTPHKVEGVEVNRSFARMHILHSTGWGDCAPFVQEGTLIGRYVLHYEDGGVDNIPIVYGRDVRDWYAPADA